MHDYACLFSLFRGWAVSYTYKAVSWFPSIDQSRAIPVIQNNSSVSRHNNQKCISFKESLFVQILKQILKFYHLMKQIPFITTTNSKILLKDLPLLQVPWRSYHVSEKEIFLKSAVNDRGQLWKRYM